ncbi:hypothetical protein F5B22DRAFT_657736 [Xylaria bambusicola]|uniref:uncharacterized protein n=1 Tax=Xylaria bambusicola TaxID=326684 RepID=UPI0020080911|nr:uncharacterized protein F5B22DRAFT_657736 [Xylaria bambusicola]KAI0512625.1 hypothetical protein F5B22DRAFT_657736 [Xylaria bambusicola]
MPCFYELRMLRLFEQYELSDNARTMFKALEEFKTARIDEAALGRLIRLSPNNRAALLNTMVKCAAIMKDKPKESKYCLDIITSCGSMLEIADRPPQEVGFPGFLKLPREIRDRIYDLYLKNHRGAPYLIPHPKSGSCACAPHESHPYSRFNPVQLALGRTSKQVSNELLTCFYRKRTFYFPCACEMNYHLTNNVLLKTALMHVMFHWCGELADVGIRQLQNMNQLETLTVVISKTTSRLLTEREHTIRQFFGTRRNSQGFLTESLGWEELIEIRGLKKVRVEHVDKRKADRRTDGDRRSLENMLVSYLLRPAKDDQ